MNYRFIILLLAAFWGDSSVIAAPASGTLTATKSCNAYASKNKQTNPGQVQIKIQQTYTIVEVNRTKNPDWYRIHVDNAQPSERWVATHCGSVSVKISGHQGHQDNKTPCQTAGLEDNYKLALSWQPAFCESHRDKPECKISDSNVYQARNFTLHGLWPNKKECGTRYGFCGEVKNKQGDFCHYPALDLSAQIRKELEQVMPSTKALSCLQRHEWHKHGTCQKNWSMDEYHTIAIDLTRQFNESGIAYFISRNIGKTIKESEFFNRVDCVFGKGARKRIQTKCKNGNLVDVYINLPVNVSENESLADLILRAQPDSGSSCNGSFKIDPIGFSN